MSYRYYYPDSDDGEETDFAQSPGPSSQVKQFDQAWFSSRSSTATDSDVTSSAGFTCSAPEDVPSSEIETATTVSYDLDEVEASDGCYLSTVMDIPDEKKRLNKEHGRGFHNFDTAIYHLPADEEEWDRLDKQHRTFIDAIGEKYPAEMYEILRSDIAEEKRVLDLGCGTGCWIKDVARDFPYCEAVGVDLVVNPDPRDLPPNLKYEMDDINEGLSHFANQFDVVHVRLIASGVKDYQLLIEEVARILRPGGLIQLQEFDFHVYDCHKRRMELSLNEIGPPWWGRWMTFLNEAIRRSRGDVDAATHLEKWVRTHPAFERVVYKDVWLPVVAGPLENPQDDVYTRLKDDVTAFLRSGRPALLKSGLSEDQVDRLEFHSMREFYESDKTQYTRLQCVHAIRKDIRLDPLSPQIPRL